MGKRLAELRKRGGFSQEQLGRLVGVSRQTVSKWELGDSLR
ncbi:MAG: helix-turn-helix domain-containing protein [Lachnospiraceae bacterium]|nr:helix-turn-helix domain-containing protein [Lachnospiraceae bacterium]